MPIKDGASKLVTAYTKPELYVNCPVCGEGETRVDHCKNGFSSAWYCDDCGVRYEINRIGDQFRLQPLKERKLKTLVTLESEGPVRLLVEGMEFTNADGSRDLDSEHHSSYFYDEHTCPTNFMGNVVRIIDPIDGDTDPHGIFAFVSVEPWRDVENDDFPVESTTFQGSEDRGEASKKELAPGVDG